MDGINKAELNLYNVSLPQAEGISPALRRANLQPISADYFVSSGAAPCAQSPIESGFDNFLVQNAPQFFMNKYLDEKVVANALVKNPAIAQTLHAKGIEPKIYMDNIGGKNKEHFLAAYKAANKFSNTLTKEEYILLLKSALLHDVGKSLIPSEILEKPAKLTEEERNIVDIHADLGREILKTTKLEPKVANLVGMHHTEATNPQKQNNRLAQILSVLDVYSALKEERSYKRALSDKEAYEIMKNDSKLNPELVDIVFSM